MAKVLVLCQRRKGVSNELNSINERIHQLAHNLVGDAEINYVSSKSGYTGEVDMEFDFDDNEKTSALDTDYSLIICNTCPFPQIKYRLIHHHLRNGGYLALTVYNKSASMPAEDFERTGTYYHAERTILSVGFQKVGYVNDAIVFQKVNSGAEKDEQALPSAAALAGFTTPLPDTRSGGKRKRRTRSIRRNRTLRRRGLIYRVRL